MAPWQVGEKTEQKLYMVVSQSRRGLEAIHGIYTCQEHAEFRMRTTIATGVCTPETIAVQKIECDVWPNGNIDCY